MVQKVYDYYYDLFKANYDDGISEKRFRNLPEYS